MTSRQRVLEALNLKAPDRVPFVELLVDEVIATKILGIQEDRSEPKPPLLEPGKPIVGPFGGGSGLYQLSRLAEKLNLDGFGFGIQAPFWTVLTANQEGREFLTEGLVRTRKDLEGLHFPDPKSTELYEPGRLFLRENRKDYAVFAFINLGLDPVIHSMGLVNFCYALHDDLDFVVEFLDLYTDWIAETVPRICALGFDFVWAGDDLAFNTGPFFSPALFREALLPSLRKVAERINIPWAFHSDGNILPILEDLLSLGMNALHPIDPNAMDINVLKRDYGNRVCLIGNIDLGYTLTRGTKEETEQEVKRRIFEIGANGGYIVSSANCITSYVNIDNVLTMARAVRKYGSYPLNRRIS